MGRYPNKRQSSIHKNLIHITLELFFKKLGIHHSSSSSPVKSLSTLDGDFVNCFSPRFNMPSSLSPIFFPLLYKMKKEWRFIEEKYPTIICNGCAAHGLNLIFCDMRKLETCNNIIKQVKGVIKEFRRKHMLVDKLKTMQKAENVN